MYSSYVLKGDKDGDEGRSNKHDVDLNRDFPDQFRKSLWEKFKEPETIAVMNWSEQYPFVLSASIHGGALVAVYPFDGSSNETAYHAATPDDETFQHLAGVYSQTHKRMYSGSAHCNPKVFSHGISNGNAWYPLFGGMQDWNYLHTGCMEITLELSCDKYPRADRLMQYWKENRYPLIRFVAEVHRALKGFIIDGSTTLPIGNASIHVLGNSHVVRSTIELGEYWRLLPPDGQVTLWASKTGYFDSDKITISAAQLPFVEQTRQEQLNFTLWPSNTEDWSIEIDFGIQLNQRPSYFAQPSVNAAVRSTAIGDFVRLFHLDSTEQASSVLGAELTIVAHGMKRGTAADQAKIHLAKDIRPLPGRTRILLLAGLHEHDLVSTEMTIRMLRHYTVGLNMLDRHVSHLLSTQLVVLPYLDPTGINRVAKLARSPDSSDSLPGICLVHGPQFEDTLEALQSAHNSLKTLVRSFRPHLILLLTSSPSVLTSWSVRGTSFAAPISPVFVPHMSAAGVSPTDLLGDLAYEYANGFGMLNQSNPLCDRTSDRPQNGETFLS
ncbi:unnamed protein product [Echinostoma caproni]|uniref:Peptidase_M14 domain-containing protein n=1 Tax=Echinostoma caproni TaxID=27848 RepID=A0A183AMM3_9TREM|nr:unnamed protein product [Echinostoma caproni]